MNTKEIKLQAKQVGLITAGFMGANAITKVAPVKNEKIKAILPLVIGIGAMVASKNDAVRVIGAGAASFGLLKVVRSVVVGSDPTGTNGIGGIGDNPMVKKMIDMLVPNLGEIEVDSFEDYYQPAIVDVPFEEAYDKQESIGALPLNTNNDLKENSLLGYSLPEDSEMYL